MIYKKNVSIHFKITIRICVYLLIKFEYKYKKKITNLARFISSKSISTVKYFPFVFFFIIIFLVYKGEYKQYGWFFKPRFIDTQTFQFISISMGVFRCASNIEISPVHRCKLIIIHENDNIIHGRLKIAYFNKRIV